MTKLAIELPKEIKRLEILVKTLVTSKVIGNYKSVFRGRGLEFESYREYSSDDDAFRARTACPKNNGRGSEKSPC